MLMAPWAQATSPFSCKLVWDKEASSGTYKSDFTLERRAEIHPESGATVALSVLGREYALTVTETYGDAGDSYIEYQINCDPLLNCHGQKTAVSKGKVKSEKPFDFLPTTVAIAQLGKRKIFLFQPTADGFSFEFIQYQTEDGQDSGMRLQCAGRGASR